MDHKEEPVPTELDVKIAGIKNPTCAVVLGFSTHRVLEELFKTHKNIEHVVVIEPSIKRFHATLSRHLVAQYLTDEKIDFMVGIPMEELQSHIHQCFSRFDPKVGSRANTCFQPEIIPDPFVYGAEGVEDPSMQQLLSEIAAKASQSVFISMGCASDTFNRWKQSVRNFDNMGKCLTLERAVDKFKGMPCVVVGGGPSTEEFIKYCKKYDLTKKALIIACDASLRRLLKENIKPHIVTRCERKKTLIFDGVTKDDTKDIYYAAYPWTDPSFFELFEKNIMLFRSNGICNWTEYKHLSVDGGVSSANAALELAWRLGCKEIVVSGIDLVFIDNASHMKGTKVEFDIEKSKPKWQEQKTNDGKTAMQIPVWRRCHDEYVNSISKYKKKTEGIKIYNTSQKGAAIHGMDLVKWSALDSLFTKRVYPLKELEKVAFKYPEKELKRFEKTKKDSVEYLYQLKKDVDELFNQLQDALDNNQREEKKCMLQVQACVDPVEFFRANETSKSSLGEIYRNPAKVIEKFKDEHYPEKRAYFSNIIADTLQLDLFKTENKVRSIKNVVQVDHERLKTFISLHCNLFKLIDYYAGEIIYLLEGNQDDNCGILSEPPRETEPIKVND